MKYVLIGLMALLSPMLALAGSSGCSSTATPVSVTSGDYNATSSDCVISVDKNYFEFTYIYLPANASNGDEFLIRRFYAELIQFSCDLEDTIKADLAKKPA